LKKLNFPTLNSFAATHKKAGPEKGLLFVIYFFQ